MGLLDMISANETLIKLLAHTESGKMLSNLGMYKFYRKDHLLLPVLHVMLISFSLLYLLIILIYTTFIFYPDFAEMMNLLHVIVLLMLTLILLYESFISRSVLTKLLILLHIDVNRFTYEDDEVAKGLRAKRDEYNRMLMKGIPVIATIAWAVFILLGPITNNIFGKREGYVNDGITFHTPLPTYWFISTDNFWLGLILPFVIQIVLVTMLVVFTSGGLIVYLFFSIHLYFQLKILTHNIRSIESNVEKMMQQDRDAEDSGHVDHLSPSVALHYKRFIKDIVQHHIILKEGFNLFNTFLKELIITIFLTGAIDIAIAGILITSDDTRLGVKLTAACLCSIEVSSFAIVTFTGDWIYELSETIPDEMYSIRWFLMRPEVKKSLLIIMTKSLKPLQITAANLVPVNKEMFKTIMQTAYSYINLLVAMKRS